MCGEGKILRDGRELSAAPSFEDLPPVHFFELASRHAQPLAIPFFTMFLATCFPRSCGEPISDARYGKAP
jgi:hypothetical protein